MNEMAQIKMGVIEEFLQSLPEKAFHLGIRVVLAALVLLMGIQLIKIVRKIIRKTLTKSKVDESAVKFLDSFVKYALYFLLIILTASWLGVDAASILALLGSASVALGLALQGSLSNMAGGVLILILKPFALGDYIRDEKGNEGTVKAIDVIYTHITTFDNKVVVLPNGTLVNGCITNYTKCDMRRIDIPVGIAYDEDIREAKKVLETMLFAEKSALADQERRVFVDSLGDSAVMLNIRCWVKTSEYWEVKWRMTEATKYALDDAGIQIPYPQMDVHIQSK